MNNYLQNLLKGAYSLDVEADGPVPGLYSMLSFGFVNVDDPSISFYAELKPITENFQVEAMNVCGFTREKAMLSEDAESVMLRFKDWLQDVAFAKSNRIQVWSDNNGFDWSYLNYYMHRFLGENILGFSSRRISDFYAGLKGDISSTRDWRKFKITKHSHNALDDAKGNAEALKEIVQRFCYNKTSLNNNQKYIK